MGNGYCNKIYTYRIILVITAIFTFWTISISATCYFPHEIQGEYVMQTTINTEIDTRIQYGPINITAISIPIWGICHRRIRNNYILLLNYRETTCIRCLHLKLRSSSVLQILTQSKDPLSQCYTNEKLAEDDCPTEAALINQNISAILLFKIRDATGTFTTKEFCPIDGKFSITHYSAFNTNNNNNNNNLIKSNNNRYHINGCNSNESVVDTCPSGSTLNFRLRDCNLINYDLKFECLATWSTGPQQYLGNRHINNGNFLILTDSRHLNNKQIPKYRCAIYGANEMNGTVNLIIHQDATCTNRNRNNEDLHFLTSSSSNSNNFEYKYSEFFELKPRSDDPWPVEANFKICTFPQWMQGKWKQVRVMDQDTMIYKDPSSFKMYTFKCVGVQDEEHKYLVFSRTQCNEERYYCMIIEQRTDNIFEFKLGMNSSHHDDVYSLCGKENFQHDEWITQGRTDADLVAKLYSADTCPINGEYIGVIPDEMNFCAKLWSDCRAPELMYYQVSDCETKEIYEEREYKCLGHWTESKFLYTYTQRKDVTDGTNECFVGAMISDDEIYIKEAGDHCQRNIDPLQFGMRLNKTSFYPCIIDHDSTTLSTITTTSNHLNDSDKTNSIPSTMRPTRKTTSKSWDFDHGITITETPYNLGLTIQTFNWSLLLHVVLVLLVNTI